MKLSAKVKKHNGRLVNGDEFFVGVYYEHKARFDDEDDIDAFVEENKIDASGIDFEQGSLTLWFKPNEAMIREQTASFRRDRRIREFSCRGLKVD